MQVKRILPFYNAITGKSIDFCFNGQLLFVVVVVVIVVVVVVVVIVAECHHLFSGPV